MQKLTFEELSSRNLEKQLKEKEMKRVGYLFEKLIAPENLKEALCAASKCKKHKRQRNKIEENFDFYCKEIQDMLVNETYEPSKPEQMIIYERLSDKERIICKTPFYPDQIIGHALIQVLLPLIKRGMYQYTCANVPGRGTIYAKRSCERFIRKDPKHTKYCLKMDVKKFYPSISQERLKAKLRRLIKDVKLLRLIDKMLGIIPSGLPIGTFASQWFSNFYLQDLDHFIKEQCKVKYYVRYADDLVLFGSNKRQLLRTKQAIDTFLDVQIKDTWRIFRISDKQCVDFVGYKIYKHKTAIRKRIFRNIRRLLIRLRFKIENHRKISVKDARRFFSYYGYIKNSNSYYLDHTYIRDIGINRIKRVLQN